MSNDQSFKDIIRDDSSEPFTVKSEEAVGNDEVSEPKAALENSDVVVLKSLPSNDSFEKVDNEQENVVTIENYTEEEGENIHPVSIIQSINSFLAYLNEPANGSEIVSVDIPDDMSIRRSIMDNLIEKLVRDILESLVHLLIFLILAISVWFFITNYYNIDLT